VNSEFSSQALNLILTKREDQIQDRTTKRLVVHKQCEQAQYFVQYIISEFFESNSIIIINYSDFTSSQTVNYALICCFSVFFKTKKSNSKQNFRFNKLWKPQKILKQQRHRVKQTRRRPTSQCNQSPRSRSRPLNVSFVGNREFCASTRFDLASFSC
jgi:alpha-D-ribose 1-methylphosphonate 5-triphosphate diphosphatase PhnM